MQTEKLPWWIKFREVTLKLKQGAGVASARESSPEAILTCFILEIRVERHIEPKDNLQDM